MALGLHGCDFDQDRFVLGGEGSFSQPELKSKYNKEGLAMEASGRRGSENVTGGDCRTDEKPGYRLWTRSAARTAVLSPFPMGERGC